MDQSYHWGSMQTSLIDLAPAAAASSTSEDDERHSASRIERARRLRLVIVEDDAVASMNLEAILEELGHQICDVASTASEAVRMAEQHRPELILMDIRLARGSSGIEAARTVRDSLDIPSIFVTAHSDAATIGQAMAARPLGFVTKPYTSREIAAALAEALSSPHGLC
jgi:two-component system, response regulator PdtaR